MSPRRLYRSRRDRSLAGVAGGMAEYLDVDPTVVRILWIISIFFGGFGILLYIIMAFIVPLEPAAPYPADWARGGPAGWPQGSPAEPSAGEPAVGAAGDGETGSAPPDSSAAWANPAGGWQPPAGRGPGRGGLVLGVGLIVFGGIALANAAIPGWIAGGWVVAAVIVAIGVALLVGSMRREAS